MEHMGGLSASDKDRAHGTGMDASEGRDARAMHCAVCGQGLECIEDTSLGGDVTLYFKPCDCVGRSATEITRNL